MPLIPLIQGSRFALLQPGVPFSPSLEILRYAFINANPLQIDQSIGNSIDPMLAAFIAAQLGAGQTLTSTEISALSVYIASGRSDGWLSLMVALYPYVGGTATSHSFNLIDPAQFQTIWSGTVIHNSNGIEGDGLTGIGDTELAGNTSIFTENLAFGAYNRTPGSETSYIIGAHGTNDVGMYNLFIPGLAIFDNTNINGRLEFVPPSTFEQGLQICSRTSSSAIAAYQKGTLQASDTFAQGDLPIGNFQILAGNNSTPSARNLSLAFISKGLNETLAVAFDTATQTLQTSLSRQV